MHAILQKHHLRPATQSSSRGKPAGTSLPPPAPSAPRLPSRQRDVDEIVVLDASVSGRPPAESIGRRVVHSSSGRKFYLSSVGDLLAPAPVTLLLQNRPASQEGSASTTQQQQVPQPTSASHNAPTLLPPRPTPQSATTGISVRQSAGMDRFIPVLASHSATGEQGGNDMPLQQGGDHRANQPLQHALAEELARLARNNVMHTSRPATQTPLAWTTSQATYTPVNSPRVPTRVEPLDTLHASGANHVDGGRVSSSVRLLTSSSSSGALHHVASSAGLHTSPPSTLADVPDGDLHALLKLVIVQLLERTTGTPKNSSSAPQSPNTGGGLHHLRPIGNVSANSRRGAKSSTQPPLASEVFQKLCAAFAEATGEAIPYLNTPQAPSHEPPPVAEDPADDGVYWGASPRLSMDGPRSAPQHTTMTVADTVLQRHINILRDERDLLRKEVEALRNELDRRPAM